MIQKLKAALDADDRAVSPVIGVILMVAITVILAAVIASMTLGLGDSVSTTPQAKFNFDQSANEVTVSHASGATFDSDNTGSLKVVYTDGTTTTDVDISSGVGAGDNLATTSGLTSGSEVKVVWESPDGGSSSTLQTYEVA